MAELKTKATAASVAAFIKAIPDPVRRQDCETVLDLMTRATRTEPKMWGPSIVGFGSYHYKYESGREGDWFITGFSPRKQDLTVYLMTGVEPQQDLMRKLGKCKTGKSCIYVKRLSDLDLDALRALVDESVKHAKKTS